MTATINEELEQTKEYHRKKLLELSKPEGQDELLAEEPTLEQEQWIKRRMSGSAKSWEMK